MTLRMFLLAAASAGIYLVAMVIAPFFPGTAWYDPEFKNASRRPLGFSPQQILTYMLCVVLVAAVAFAVV